MNTKIHEYQKEKNETASKKKISFSTQGFRADIGEYKINRMLPNRYADAVGPFVFLDHVMPAKHSPGEPLKEVHGTGAHPHRGIATLTYILNGEADHHDSYGHRALVHSRGAPWMKAGNGIINDEANRKRKFIECDRNGGVIVMNNNSKDAVDIILFGGETYTEPIVAQGPFVMNSEHEIAQAYRDFHAGKYGQIIYN